MMKSMEQPSKRKRPRIKQKPKPVDIKPYKMLASDLLCIEYKIKNKIQD